MANSWYKKAQEFIGAGEPLRSDLYPTDGVVQQPAVSPWSAMSPADGFQDPSGDGKSSPLSKQKRSCNDEKTGKTLVEGERCPGCGLSMGKNEFHEKSDGSYQYICENVNKGKKCGYNSYKPEWSKDQLTIIPKRKSRLVHKGSSSISPFITAATPATPVNNPANRPYGNLDISEDVRVFPFSRIQPDLNETWDSQKQKKKLNYKVKKVKDKDGKIKFIKIKDSTSGTGIQPSNTYTQKGDIKRQNRYRVEEGIPKGQSTGAWPHNRGESASDGFYQADSVTDPNRLNSDAKLRYQTWEEMVSERDSQWHMFTKP